jgi:hypothetical protein
MSAMERAPLTFTRSLRIDPRLIVLPDETPVRSPCGRVVCTACGLIGADVRPQTKRSNFPVGAGRNVTMSRWIKKGVEFINALADQWKGSSDPSPANEKMDTI